MWRSRSVLGVVLCAAILAGGVLVGVGLGQKASRAPANVIFPGQGVAQANQILDRCRIRKSGGKQFSAVKDTDWLFRYISPEVDLVFQYSTITNKITRITVYFNLQPKLSKTDDIPLDARSIRFEKDGSYIVHFEGPEPKQQRSPGPSLTPQVPPELPPNVPTR
jgi:hypothetical protein